MNRVCCVLVLLLCGQVEAQVLPIPTSELRPYAELVELLLEGQQKQIEALREERKRLEETMPQEKRRLSPAEKRELTKTKAQMKLLDSDIEKLRRSKLPEIPRMTVKQACKNAVTSGRNQIAYIVNDGEAAVMTVTENRSNDISADHARAVLGDLKVILYKESGGSLFKVGQQYKLDRPCIIFQVDAIEFYDDSPLLEAKKPKDVR